MSNELVKFDLELRVLSPVHVGMGEKYSKLDFVFDVQKKRAGLLDERGWLDWLMKNRQMEAYTEAVQRSGAHMDNFQFLFQQGIRDPLSQCQSAFATVLDINQNVKTLNEIARQLKNVHLQPYIPGSSIKGAFRTAIMAALIRDAYKQGGELERAMSRLWSELSNVIQDPTIYRRGDLERATKPILRKLDQAFFKPLLKPNGEPQDPQLSDPFRGLLVGDSQPFPRDSTIITKKVDLVVPPGKNSVS